MRKNYVTTGELARALGYSNQAIRQMCAEGVFDGAARTRGKRGHWRIPVKHLGEKTLMDKGEGDHA